MKHLCALKYPIYLNYFIGNEAWGYWKPFPNVSITNLSYDLSKIETLKRLKKAKVSENQPNSIPAPQTNGRKTWHKMMDNSSSWSKILSFLQQFSATKS